MTISFAPAPHMFATVGISGLAQLGFIDSRDGPLLIDVNLRCYTSAPLALACGLNLPGTWHAVVEASEWSIDVTTGPASASVGSRPTCGRRSTVHLDVLAHRGHRPRRGDVAQHGSIFGPLLFERTRTPAWLGSFVRSHPGSRFGSSIGVKVHSPSGDVLLEVVGATCCGFGAE